MKYKLFDVPILQDYFQYIDYHHDDDGRTWENAMSQRQHGVCGIWLTDQLVVSQLFRALVDD